MKPNLSTTLQQILLDTEKETHWSRSRQSLKRVKQMVNDAPPVRSFRRALSSGSALIAEIKERSPSQGRMLRENFRQAPHAYKESRIVRAISVLTNRTHFGQEMRIEKLARMRDVTSKPVLRKDFITDEYQVYQSRAHGADAILLMANILNAEELRRLSDLAFEIGLDVLFETHCLADLEDLPENAVMIGINCRNFNSKPSQFRMAKLLRQWLWAQSDRSVNPARFEYASQLPSNAIKIAESGVTAKNCANVFAMGFHCALVGTSLLMDRRGVKAALEDFEEAIFRRKNSVAVSPALMKPSLA